MNHVTACASTVLVSTAGAHPPAAEPPMKPNVVVIPAFDLGNGDLGCYGHPRPTGPAAPNWTDPPS